MNVVGLQFDIAWEDKPANFATVRLLLAEARPQPGALVVLPEMFATGFSMNTEAIAEPPGGSIEQFLSSVAAEHQIFVIGGAAMRGRDGKARNKALVFGPAGDLLGFYSNTPGGSLFLCWKPEREGELARAAAHGLAPATLRRVRSRDGSPPFLVLASFRRDGPAGRRFEELPPLTIYRESDYTSEARAILDGEPAAAPLDAAAARR